MIESETECILLTIPVLVESGSLSGSAGMGRIGEMIARRRERHKRGEGEGCTQKTELCHVLYVASEEDFFDTPYNIDCDIEEHCVIYSCLKITKDVLVLC